MEMRMDEFRMDEKCRWMYFVSADIGIPSVLRFLRCSLRAEPNEAADLRTKSLRAPLRRSVDYMQLRLHRIIRSSFVRGLHMCCRPCSLALISDGVFLRAVESLVAVETAAKGTGY
jgi:hypothetical protein